MKRERQISQSFHYPGGAYGRLLVIAVVSLWILISCQYEPTEDFPVLDLVKPTLYQVGDSISALWPTDQLDVDYYVQKVAFPARTSTDILTSVEQVPPGAYMCILNGGINDYLGNLEPMEEEIEITVNNMRNAYDALKTKCGRVVFLNVWYVAPPWPDKAVRMMNVRYKELFLPTERLDTEMLISRSDTTDGLHLTDAGYRKLESRLRKEKAF